MAGVNKLVAYTNETVTLTVKPNDGYELQSITVVTADETFDLLPMQPRGKAVELIQGDDGNYTFKMPGVVCRSMLVRFLTLPFPAGQSDTSIMLLQMPAKSET